MLSCESDAGSVGLARLVRLVQLEVGNTLSSSNIGNFHLKL